MSLYPTNLRAVVPAPQPEDLKAKPASTVDPVPPASTTPETTAWAEAGPAANSIATLVAAHREAIDGLKTSVADILPASGEDHVGFRFDDLFFLRFVLEESFDWDSPKLDRPTAVRQCIEYRMNPENTAMFRAVRDGSWVQHKTVVEVRQYRVGGLIREAGTAGNAVWAYRMGISDLAGMRKAITEEEDETVRRMTQELAYWEQDTMSRRTGLLVRQSVICDVGGCDMCEIFEHMKGVSSQKSGDKFCSSTMSLFPSMYEAWVLVGAPSWVAKGVGMIKSCAEEHAADDDECIRSAINKIQVFPSVEAMWESDWAERSLVRAKLPAFLGGRLSEKAVPSELSGALLVRDSDAGSPEYTSYKISNRSSAEVRVEVPFAGAHVRYYGVLAGYSLGYGATLIPAVEKEAKPAAPGDCETKAAEAPATPAVPTASAVPVDAAASKGIVLRAVTEDRMRADALCKGEWVCPAAGTLVVTLDNTFSVLRSKTVECRFEVVVPEATPTSTPSAPTAPTRPASAGAGHASADEVVVNGVPVEEGLPVAMPVASAPPSEDPPAYEAVMKGSA